MSGSNQLAVNIWWTIPQKIVIPGDRARAVARMHGFDDEDIPVPSETLAFSRAAHSFQDRRHKSNRWVTEKVLDNGRYLKYGILRQEREGDEEVSFKQNTIVCRDKSNGVVTAEGFLASDFHVRHEDYKDAVLSEDLAAFLGKVVKMCYGIPKRPTGGMYLIPERFAMIIEDAQKVLDDLDTGAILYVEGVVNGERERENTWAAVEHKLNSKIDETLRSVERIGKRVSSIKIHESKLAEYEGLRDVYIDLLGDEARHEAISEKIADAVKTVGKKLGDLQAKVSKKTKKVGTPRGSKVVEAAIQVLQDEGRSLTYRQITDKAIAAGLYEGNCANPYESVSSALTKAILRGEDRIQRVSRGTYGLV
jgi:hypothetical protein